MAILIHREPIIKSDDVVDLSTQTVPEFNEINDYIPILDPECLNVLELGPNDDIIHIIGILISLAGIYYFTYEIIKKVLG